MSPPPSPQKSSGKPAKFMALSDDSALPSGPCVLIDAAVVEEIRTGIQTLNTALTGDALGNKGLVRRVEDLEMSDRATTRKLAVWGGIVTGGIFVLSWLKDTVFKK